MRKQTVIASIIIILAGLSCYKSNPISPGADGSWIPLGLAGKQITKLKTSPSYVYACAYGDGLYRLPKSSLADSWKYIGLADTTLINGIDTISKIPIAELNDVAVNPNNENEMLASILLSKPNIPGIYKTTNGGLTWFEADSGYGFYVNCYDSGTIKGAGVLFSPPNQFNTIFAATLTDGYLFRSANSGKDWGLILDTDLYSITNLVADPSNQNIIYASLAHLTFHCATDNKIIPDLLIVTSDGGNSWTETQLIPFRFSPSFYNRIYDICVTGTPRTIYVGVISEVFGSKDNGSTWTKLLSIDNPSSFPLSIVVDPSNNNNILAAAGSLLFRSKDAGTIWTQLKIPESFGGSIAFLVWDKESGNLYAVDGGNTSSVYSRDGRGVFVLPKASSVLFKN